LILIAAGTGGSSSFAHFANLASLVYHHVAASALPRKM
jgi:hypothetical protein